MLMAIDNVLSFIRLHKHGGNYEKEKGVVTKILQDLKWSPLETRRNVHRLTIMYKITNKLIDIPLDSRLQPNKRFTRGHNKKYQEPSARIELTGTPSIHARLKNGTSYQPILWMPPLPTHLNNVWKGTSQTPRSTTAAFRSKLQFYTHARHQVKVDLLCA